jgi:hypothetical protein
MEYKSSLIRCRKRLAIGSELKTSALYNQLGENFWSIANGKANQAQYNKGYKDGCRTGYLDGFREGKSDSKKIASTFYHKVSKNDYDKGYERGYSDCFPRGYAAGLNFGFPSEE